MNEDRAISRTGDHSGAHPGARPGAPSGSRVRGALNLTAQVRAIAEVASAVAQGDMSRSIAVETRGEVSELKDNINLMMSNLRETTRAKDWLESNLARLAGLMQGHRDLMEVADLILRELTPLVNAQFGAFFLAGPDPDGTPSHTTNASTPSATHPGGPTCRSSPSPRRRCRVTGRSPSHRAPTSTY